MADSKTADNGKEISRDRLAELLNEDLAREYQAIIGYVVYSQVLKGAEFMSIAEQLEAHAHEELKHAARSSPATAMGCATLIQPSRTAKSCSPIRVCS